MATERYQLFESAVPKAEACMAEAVRIVNIQYGPSSNLLGHLRIAHALLTAKVFEKLMDCG